VKNPIEAFAFEWPEDDVHVVRHHGPGAERVSTILEVVKVLRNSIRELWVSEMTRTTLDVQFVVETDCEGLLDVEALDGGETAETARDLELHLFLLAQESMPDFDGQGVV